MLLSNQVARLVDENMNDVADGEEGELLVRGPNVMKGEFGLIVVVESSFGRRLAGYLNRPDATEETITSDGFLRTGDLAVVDSRGRFYIRDRLKEVGSDEKRDFPAC